MRSGDLLDDFTEYCQNHPSERFWQALRNWSGQSFLLASKQRIPQADDTFYWDARNGMKRGVDAE